MPITMQKRRYSKQEAKAIAAAASKLEVLKSSNDQSCLSKLAGRIPAALILLFLIFLWSSSTTYISGSIVHVCVASRKLNSHLYCVSAGARPSDDANSTSPSPDPVIPVVIRSPLSSLSSSVKESTLVNKKSPTSKPVQQQQQQQPPPDPIHIQLPFVDKNKDVSDGSESKRSPASKPVQQQQQQAQQQQQQQQQKQQQPPPPGTIHIELPPVSKSKDVTDGSESKKTPTTEQVQQQQQQRQQDGSGSSREPGSITIRERIQEEAPKKDLDESTSTPGSITNREKKDHKTEMDEELERGKKDTEEQIEVLRSYKTGKMVNYNSHGACEGRGIFIYDLPSKFNKDLLGYCSNMIPWQDLCKFLLNGAFGEPVPQLGDGWYNTHQYALEPIFHARLLKHPCRVYDPEEAKVFYVPYYGGFDILRWHFNKTVTIKTKDSLSYELISWLEKQNPWRLNFGLDHLFVLGKISWDFRRMQNITWGTHFLDLDEMQNPMKLLIERHPWQINDVGVPHPSFFHPRSDNDIIAWQIKLMQAPRKHLVSFAGAPRPKARESIRSILIEQCTSSPENCKHFDCSEGRCAQPAPMVELFMESEFCLQPPGDSPTRKSVFDSLVAGCIPVLFCPFTAYYQYPWHLPAERGNYSVFIDQEEVRRREVNVVDRLAAIPAARRAEMRRYIVQQLLPGLVYADPAGKLEKFEDAFSVAMNAVLERMIKLP